MFGTGPSLPEGKESERTHTFTHTQHRVQQLHATEEELESSSTDPAQEAARMASLYERHTRASQSFARCYACQGAEAQLACSTCRRWFHTLCLEYPSLGPQFVPAQRWVCPGCKTEQQVGAEAAPNECHAQSPI